MSRYQGNGTGQLQKSSALGPAGKVAIGRRTLTGISEVSGMRISFRLNLSERFQARS